MIMKARVVESKDSNVKLVFIPDLEFDRYHVWTRDQSDSCFAYAGSETREFVDVLSLTRVYRDKKKCNGQMLVRYVDLGDEREWDKTMDTILEKVI